MEISKIMADYLRKSENVLYDISLISEMETYSVNLKAEQIYWKCIKASKFNIAHNIKEKYNLKTNDNDQVIAYGLCLLHNTKKK